MLDDGSGGGGGGPRRGACTAPYLSGLTTSSHASVQELSNLLWSIASMGIYPGAGMMDALSQARMWGAKPAALGVAEPLCMACPASLCCRPPASRLMRLRLPSASASPPPVPAGRRRRRRAHEASGAVQHRLGVGHAVPLPRGRRHGRPAVARRQAWAGLRCRAAWRGARRGRRPPQQLILVTPGPCPACCLRACSIHRGPAGAVQASGAEQPVLGRRPAGLHARRPAGALHAAPAGRLAGAQRAGLRQHAVGRDCAGCADARGHAPAGRQAAGAAARGPHSGGLHPAVPGQDVAQPAGGPGGETSGGACAGGCIRRDGAALPCLEVPGHSATLPSPQLPGSALLPPYITRSSPPLPRSSRQTCWPRRRPSGGSRAASPKSRSPTGAAACRGRPLRAPGRGRPGLRGRLSPRVPTLPAAPCAAPAGRRPRTLPLSLSASALAPGTWLR